MVLRAAGLKGNDVYITHHGQRPCANTHVLSEEGPTDESAGQILR